MRKAFLIFIGIVSCLLVSSQELTSQNFSLPSQEVDSLLIDSMLVEIRKSGMNGNAVKSLKQAKWTYQAALTLGNKQLIARSHFFVANGYQHLDLVDSSLIHYEQVRKDLSAAGIGGGWLYYSFYNPIDLLRISGLFDRSIKLGYEALDTFENLEDSLYIGKICSDIGYIYDRMKEYRLSIQWQKRAREIFEATRDKENLMWTDASFGIAYDDLAIFDSAHFFNKRALSYAEAINDSFGMISFSSNIANTYLKQKKWKSALNYSKKAVSFFSTTTEDGRKAIVFINLGTAQMNNNQFVQSNQSLQKGLRFAKSWGGPKYESEAYEKLYQLNVTIQNYDSALYYYKKHKVLEDSLYSIEKTKEVLALSTRYETEKKEQQILLQEATLQEKERELRVKQQTILLLVALTLLVIVVAFGLYKRYQARKEAELQSRVITEQEKGIQAVFQAQEEERKRISKDLHDGVGQQLSGIKMAFHRIAKTLQEKDPEQKEAMDKLGQVITESADEVRSISHQMMPRVLTEVGLVEAIQGMLEKSLKLSGIEFDFEQFGMTERLPEQLEIGLYRVCQELINNIIKHSGAKQVNVQLMKNKKNIVLLVEDDGLGISPSKSEGHGLLNMKSRINTLNGEVNLELSPTRGTLATIRIPF